MGFLDIHNHILPGIDDGSRNIDESISMALALYEAGVREIVATPHFEVGLYFNTRDKILREWEKLQKEFFSRGININLHPGSEVMLTPEVPELLKEGKIMTMKDEGNFILVEFPLSQMPLYIEDVLYEIKLMGIQPIIAHPERYRKISKELIEDNLLQLNIGSFFGSYGQVPKEKAERILKIKNDQEIFFATDAHRLQEEQWAEKYIRKLNINKL
ncbi:MAG: hypothetical protein PHH19_03410 [Eubacteriales bacterium]|nr:hypothetical protein [Eubacteriales bacterium]